MFCHQVWGNLLLFLFKKKGTCHYVTQLFNAKKCRKSNFVLAHENMNIENKIAEIFSPAKNPGS